MLRLRKILKLYLSIVVSFYILQFHRLKKRRLLILAPCISLPPSAFVFRNYIIFLENNLLFTPLQRFLALAHGLRIADLILQNIFVHLYFIGASMLCNVFVLFNVYVLPFSLLHSGFRSRDYFQQLQLFVVYFLQSDVG